MPEKFAPKGVKPKPVIASIELTDWRLKQELKARGLTITGKKAAPLASLELSDSQAATALNTQDELDSEEEAVSEATSTVSKEARVMVHANMSVYAFDEEDEEQYASGSPSRQNISQSALPTTSRTWVLSSEEGSFVAAESLAIWRSIPRRR